MRWTISHTKLLSSMDAPGLDGAYCDLDKDARDLGVISLSLDADITRLGVVFGDLDGTPLGFRVRVWTLDDDDGYSERCDGGNG